jgi:antitoxin component of MazEF toxin-antitoxin module
MMKRELDGAEWGMVYARQAGNSKVLTIPSELQKLLQLKPRDKFVVYCARQANSVLIVYRKAVNDSVLDILKAAVKK